MSRSVRHVIGRSVRRLTEHPLTTLVTALGLFLGGAMELAEEMVPGFDHALGVHHGVILVGFVGILRGITELVEGAEKAVDHPSLSGEPVED